MTNQNLIFEPSETMPGASMWANICNKLLFINSHLFDNDAVIQWNGFDQILLGFMTLLWKPLSIPMNDYNCIDKLLEMNEKN